MCRPQLTQSSTGAACGPAQGLRLALGWLYSLQCVTVSAYQQLDATNRFKFSVADKSLARSPSD